MIPAKVTLTNLGKKKLVHACRFASKLRQLPLTEASTGVDHASASPDDANQFAANGSCSARGFHSLRNRQENVRRLLRQRKQTGARKGLHRVQLW